MEAWIIIAGILQGLLEWLPVSSSGQVSLYYMHIAGLTPQEAYRASIALHLGTALGGALLVRRELVGALRGGPWRRILVAPLVAGAPVGLAIMKTIEEAPGDLVNLAIGLGLIATGLLLKKAPEGLRRAQELGIGELALVGVLQGLAALPGLSRSAVTLVGLLALKVEPGDAVRVSILIGVPVTMAAGLLQLATGGAQLSAGEMVWGVVAAGAAGALSAGFMIRLASSLAPRLPLLLVALGLLVLAPYAPLVLNPL